MTNSNILIIHKFPILFSILNEIKSNLNFKVDYENKEEINQSLSKKNKLGAYKHFGFWQCMDTLRDKEILEKKVRNKEHLD